MVDKHSNQGYIQLFSGGKKKEMAAPICLHFNLLLPMLNSLGQINLQYNTIQ